MSDAPPAPPTIHYQITPHRFVLDIPVEALANLGHDSHTRLIAMLNDWIIRHKPLTVKGSPDAV